MGEIDRINPIIAPVLGPRPNERVQPGSDRHHRKPDDREDLLEEDETDEEPVSEPQAESKPPPPEPEHGLDLSI
ncbi:MAG TPA: hypothetical protein VMI31_06685 [Fimbriimonadaceae bacterium]|nr:hypothetical protein [Fimbriimonadaceae bacterium]